MSKAKKAQLKEWRTAFRQDVLKRDNFTCRNCGKAFPNGEGLDAHHIQDRHDLPNGGYVVENGISLCDVCHEMAEIFHRTRERCGIHPDEFYARIESSREKALEAARKLSKP